MQSHFFTTKGLSAHSFFLQPPSPCDAYWSTYLSIDSAVTEVFRTIPEITDQRELHTAELDVKLNPSLVLARGYIQATLIILHSIDADREYDPAIPRSEAQQVLDESRRQLARDKTILAARLMAKDIRRVEDTSFLYSHACLGVSFTLPFPLPSPVTEKYRYLFDR